MKMKHIFEELGIPEAYLQKTAREDRFIALVHKLWLKSLIKHLKLSDFIKKSCQEIWHFNEENHPSWIKIFISVMKKKDCKVLPLPKTRTLKEEAPFLFPQLMQYIFQTNYTSLWKNSHKKYSTPKLTGDTRVNLVDYNNVLRESISRIYGCSIINLYHPELTIDSSKHCERHLNIFPTACAVETVNAIFVLHLPYLKHNLSDCVTFSPAILEKSHTKALFIAYQLLNVLKSLHECSVTLGEVHLNDFFMTEDLWIYVFPDVASNFHFVDNYKFASRDQKSIQDCQKHGHIFDNNLKCDFCGAQTYDEVEVADESLEQLCFLWICRKISNFTYILALNKFAGRVWGDPNCHYVFPWVTDFTSRCGKNWRDLKKSKYRLNKGDHQLDLTHDNCQAQVPHHVSDVLSSITYYVYMARRTSASILCRNVRTVWVPAEYPSSIQRIQEWTPDECIPEFYSDPSVFRSIHDDLEDLAVPPWAAGPEDFIEKHREALESACVSDKIHHWIDLTFGYKLSGGASVKAKNVCLNLVDDHEYLTKSGLVQLFSSPHPPRAIDSPYWAKSPPKLFVAKSGKQSLYGEQFILFQYIPHMTELILLCKKRITPNLEGGLISCLALLKKIIPCLSDVMLMDQLQDVLLKNLINPVVKILDSTKHIFPSGGCARNILARKYLDALYVLSIRIGTDMTKKYLMTPGLQRFFSIFDIVYCEKISWEPVDEVILPKVQNISLGSEKFLSRSIPSGSQESNIPAEEPHARLKGLKSNDCGSPYEEERIVIRALKELKEAFTPELAYTAYLPLIKLLGSSSLEISLNNHDRIRCLCQAYEESLKVSNSSSIPTFKLSDYTKNQSVKSSNSIGSNVSLIGNRIDVQPEHIDNMNLDLLTLVSNRIENNTRHLRGNWLAYWEHEIGRSDINNLLNFKQIKLQTFVGHSQSVKCLYTLDNENSFLSGSRDKTIKLWSLRSQGDGLSTSNCQWTYNAHKKPILSITFIESVRLVASCDSVVHIWDPFMGVNLGILESSKFAPVNALKSMPAPSTLVFASTTDGTLKILDTRMLQYVQELKTSVNPFGLIRCLAVAPSGLWLAAGQSSGNITVLDTRTGLILANWRAHESEVLQLVVHNDDTVISTSLDQNTSVWNISDGKLKFHLKGTTEPVHCLSIHNNELISGTTANRIGVHASIDPDASFSNNKLRTDTFKGLLTSMDYLPLNKLILLGADTGNINLLC